MKDENKAKEHLIKELRKRSAELEKSENLRKLAEALNEALNNIYLTINSTLDFDEMMQRVVKETAKAIGTETAAISLCKDNLWIVSYIYGFPQELVGTQRVTALPCSCAFSRHTT